MKLNSVIASAIRFGRGAAGDAVVAWKGDTVYCLSYDRTVCLRVRHVVPIREDEVAFRACDYEGPDCVFLGKHVIFKINEKAKVRVPRPPHTFTGLEIYVQSTPTFGIGGRGFDLGTGHFVVSG